MYEPSADNRIAAASLYDLYQGYVHAGFTEGQAMQLICTIMSAAVASPPKHDD